MGMKINIYTILITLHFLNTVEIIIRMFVTFHFYPDTYFDLLRNLYYGRLDISPHDVNKIYIVIYGLFLNIPLVITLAVKALMAFFFRKNTCNGKYVLRGFLILTLVVILDSLTLATYNPNNRLHRAGTFMGSKIVHFFYTSQLIAEFLHFINLGWYCLSKNHDDENLIFVRNFLIM